MADLANSRRVHLIGPMASGKSTTARRLADRLGLAFIELDGIRHQPNWTVKSDAAFRADVHAALDAAPQGWVAAGHYFTELGTTVIGQADTILWLRLPFYQTFPRLFLRSVKRCWSREPLWNGNRESWRVVFLSRYSPLLEAWQKRHGRIAFFTGILNTLSPRPQLLVLNSYDEVAVLMRELTGSGESLP